MTWTTVWIQVISRPFRKNRGETVSSTEKGGESNLWTGTNHRQPALDEIPDEETAGSPQFKSARLEEPFDDEQEKNWGERNWVPRTYS